jgi:hypothetical protein
MSPDLAAALARAIAEAPGARFASTADLVAAIERALARRGHARSPST